MQIVLQVGEPEQFLQLPENWPKCGNYLPPVMHVNSLGNNPQPSEIFLAAKIDVITLE